MTSISWATRLLWGTPIKQTTNARIKRTYGATKRVRRIVLSVKLIMWRVGISRRQTICREHTCALRLCQRTRSRKANKLRLFGSPFLNALAFGSTSRIARSNGTTRVKTKRRCIVSLLALDKANKRLAHFTPTDKARKWHR